MVAPVFREEDAMHQQQQETNRVCSKRTMRLFIAFAAAGIALICVFYYQY
jgi:hypothetical protein